MSITDARLQKLIRSFSAEDIVFKQGEVGNSMYLVIEGLVRIYFDSPQGQLLVAVLGPGEIVGEKALLQKDSYKRTMTAQAKTAATVMEIDFDTQKIAYQIWPDFQTKMFKMVLQRLDKANKLVTVLQQREPMDRMGAYVLYYAREICKNFPAGTPITITANEMKYGANLEKEFVDSCIEGLVGDKIFVPTRHNAYVINVDAFENYLPSLRERMAA